MSWFTVSILIGTKAIEPIDKDEFIRIEENIYLIEASDQLDASRKAMSLPLIQLCSSDGITINDRPAISQFIGIRDINLLDTDEIKDGIEVFNVSYLIENEETFIQLINSNDVDIIYS